MNERITRCVTCHRTCLAGDEYCRRFCPLFISGDFNRRRRAASLDLSVNLGDTPPPLPPVDTAGETGVDCGGARDPTEAIRRAVPMRGVLRGDGGTGSDSGS